MTVRGHESLLRMLWKKVLCAEYCACRWKGVTHNALLMAGPTVSVCPWSCCLPPVKRRALCAIFCCLPPVKRRALCAIFGRKLFVLKIMISWFLWFVLFLNYFLISLSASFGMFGFFFLFRQECFLRSRNSPRNIATINLLRNCDSRLLINMLPSASLNISCQSFSV